MSNGTGGDAGGMIGGIIQAVGNIIFNIIEKVKAYENRRAHKYWYGLSSGEVLVTRKQDEWLEWLRNDTDYIFNALNIALIQRTAAQRCLGQIPGATCNDGHRPFWCDYYELLGRVASELPHKYNWKWYYMLGNSWYQNRTLLDYSKERKAGRPAPSEQWVKKVATCNAVAANSNVRFYWPRHPRAVDFCLFLCEYGLFRPQDPPPLELDLQIEGIIDHPQQGWIAQGITRDAQEVKRVKERINAVYMMIDAGEFDRAALEVFKVNTKKARDERNQAAQLRKVPVTVQTTPAKLNRTAIVLVVVVLLLIFLTVLT